MNIDYILTRSRRKTIALHVRSDGSVEVRAPLWLPKKEIERFVAAKEKWISQKLAERYERQTRRAAFSLDYGDTVLYLGKPCLISAGADRRIGYDDGVFYVPPHLPPPEIKQTCVQIYRDQARRILPDRLRYYAAQMLLTPAAVKISGAATRWGSCSAKGNINLSWRLMMADEEVIDYVLIHELAHLRELNHSPRFWAIVAAALPDHRTSKARLRELQKRLRDEDWDDLFICSF